MTRFTDIKDKNTLISYLKEKGENHDYYYHYTTWESLTKIFEGKTFLLTRGNSLQINDQHEALMKGSWEEWNKIYIGSFAFGSAENMAMWGLYGLPWQDAVRLSIPKCKMLQWVNGIEKIGLFEDGRIEEYPDCSDINLNDIVYINGRNDTGNPQLTHYGRSITVGDTYPLYGIDTAKEMTGYIKNYAWQYENEVRIRIRLAHDTGYEKIIVKIPDEVVESIIVTTGPYFKWKNDALYSKLIADNRIIESGFKNLVRYKELCAMCQHEQFLKKR